MTAISWKLGLSDVWTDAAAWSPGMVPGSGDDVIIAVAPVVATLPYTITLQGNASVHSVTQTQADSILAVSFGSLSVAGTYTLSAGQVELSGATLQAATLASTGGTVLIGQSGATLSNTSIHGSLQIVGTSPGSYAGITLDGDSFAGAGGSGSASLLLGPNVYATLGTSPTLDNVNVTLDGATFEQDGGTLTLGSHFGITAASGSSQLGQQFGQALVSDARVSVTGSGTNLTITGNTLVNDGTITVGSGAELYIQSQTASNAGLLSVGAGAYLQIAATGSGGFTDTGSITLGSGGTLSLDTTLTTSQLAAFPLAAGTLAIAGVLDNTGATLRPGGAGSGIGALSLQGGTITGGTIVNAGAFTVVQPPLGAEGNFAGELVGVTVQGGLSIASSGTTLDVAGGLTVTPSVGSGPGSISVTGQQTSLEFQDSETLNHVAIVLGSASGTLESNSLSVTSPTGAANDLTLGPQTTVSALGYRDFVEGEGQSFISNDGTINATAPGGELLLGSVDNAGLIALSGEQGSFGGLINTGTITGVASQIEESQALVNGGTISISGPTSSYSDFTEQAGSGLINSGLFSVSNGASANLGFYGAGWSNSGTLAISAATLTVGGSFTLAQLGHVVESSGGTLGLDGTLTNVGTLTLGAAGTLASVALQFGGEITGGTISAAGGGLLLQGGLLQSTKYEGVLSLTQADASLEVGPGLVLTGASGSGLGSIALTGVGSTLTSFGGTLDGAVVSIGAAGAGSTLTTSYGQTLTLGSQLAVDQVGAAAQLGQVFSSNIVNRGAIVAGVAGGTLSLVGGSFANAGTIAVSNGETLALDVTSLTNTGSFTVTNSVVDAFDSTITEIQALRLTNSQVAVTGTLMATGGTLSAGAGGTISTLKLNGDLVGGTIHDGGGAVQFVGASTLDGVTYQGALTIDRPFASVTVADGLNVTSLVGTQPGTITLTGPGSSLVWGSGQALDNAVLDIGSASNTYAAPALLSEAEVAPPAVQLGAHLHVQQTGTYATIGGVFGTFTSAGVIGANIAHGQFSLGGDRFTNTGTIGISNGDTVSATAGGFTNAGLIVVGAGTAFDLNLVDYFASGSLSDQSFTNTGTVMMAGGILAELTDNGAFPNVPFLNAAGGDLVGTGVVASQIDNDGTIEARGGVLNLVQKVMGTGALRVDAGAMLVTGGVSAGQTASFIGTGGVLGLTPPYFLGTIGGFASGDTIDLFNTAARSAAFSGDTLVVTLTSGATLRLATTSALSGSLSVTAGTHGDSLIRFAPAGPSHSLPALSPEAAPETAWAGGTHVEVAPLSFVGHFGHAL